ncbi:thiol:disulfide interchange protein TlpA [Afifella pfennigii]|uniref:thiol:disulfide interchange protein TlpA n=1 Tax=Afifella pfennigii TaxID=209897 RepID=UPI000A052ECE|nr:TlpA disulfide reductase family protein [Afifella pfennigii]
MKRATSALAAAIIIAAGIAVALYGISSDGNEGTLAAGPDCRPAVDVAAALEPLMGGEIAALIPASRPQNLSSLAFTDQLGEARTLGELSGQLKLVNLWATWCAPCREEMPALDALQAGLGGENFAVVPINIDRTEPARPRQFLEEIGVAELPLYTDRTMKIFNDMKAKGLAVGLPVTALIDGNGCLIAHMNGPAEWNSPDARELIAAALRQTGLAGRQTTSPQNAATPQS